MLVDGRFLNTRKVLRRCGQPVATFFPVVPAPVPRRRCKTTHMLFGVCYAAHWTTAHDTISRDSTSANLRPVFFSF